MTNYWWTAGGFETRRQLDTHRPLKNARRTNPYGCTCSRLGKRRQALLESNLPRNTQPETHSDESAGRPVGLSAWLVRIRHRDRFPHVLKNSKPRATTSTRVFANARTPPAGNSRGPSASGLCCRPDRGTHPHVAAVGQSWQSGGHRFLRA